MKTEPKFNPLVPELTVSNLEKSRYFYEVVLGFRIVYSRSDFYFLEKQGAQIMITTDGYDVGELEAPRGRGINFEIEVENIDPLLKALEEKAYPLWRQAQACRYDCGGVEVTGRQFLVQDPDGYLLRFSSAQ